MFQTYYPVPCVPGEPHGIGHCVKRGPVIAAGSPWQALAALSEWPDIETPADPYLIDGDSPVGTLVYVQSGADHRWYAAFQEIAP